jgi:hypothetical protein
MSANSDGIKSNCPHCDAGNVARFRTDTREWVHDYIGRTTVSHTICTAKRVPDVGE